MAAKGRYQEWITDDGLLMIEGWARDGLTEKQIAKNIGVNERTFATWKDRFPSIKSALKKGKAPVDIEVENALLKSALGYTYKVRKPVKLKEEKQKPGVGKVVTERIEYVEEEIYVPANITAQIFWLKNRKSKYWRDRQIVEADTTALDKLDAILQESRKNAARKDDYGLSYISEDDIQQETTRIHPEGE